ncbi:MAG TPA: hypothetical protein VME18_05190 [Acidobacteriaceae bacterium]|nr:hypothetical protein [Acidobacteriaceae bacterium]
MRKTLLLLTLLLLAAPVFGVKAPKHPAHPVVHHAKNSQYPKKRGRNPQYPKKRGRNPQFRQSAVRKPRHKLAQNHPRNPNLPKHRKGKHSRKHKG